ncbi:hypothetical protein SNE40_005703 [Patella caerulea]|uniref:Sperm-tail PG-rich repeat-containing protein 2 n=1 Tax=Patella caerulea TaxID=87958 RepID=A0AAN8K208_PATCE
MYDRAERVIGSLCGSTPAVVGPGTYESNRLSHIKADGYAPFLSMTSRETFLNVNDQVVAAPGPGHYDLQASQIIVKGGSTVANKSKRFDDSLKETPGPGSYNVHASSDFTIQSKSAPAASRDPNASRIKYHRKPEAPSIPCPGQAYGYEDCDDGSLKKQNAPERDVSIGPAFYKLDHSDTRTVKQYKGVHFGKMSSKRSDFHGKHGPGPGDYDPYIEPLVKAENTNLHEEETKRYDARIPRYHEVVTLEEEKRSVPGPGKYDIKGQFDPLPAKVNTEGIEVEHPPFLSQSKRFQPVKKAVPAPGTYNDPRTALESLRRVTGLKRSPFSQTSVRFNNEHHIRKIPGPGSYNIAGMGSESMRKAYLQSTRRGVFGTTSARIQVLNKKEETEIPGPAHYQVKDKPYTTRLQQMTSNFSSLTNRLTEPPSVVKEIPPPGSYEVHKSYINSQITPHRAKPRNETAKKKHGSFLSAASRFAPARNVVVEQPDPDVPGPGAYDNNTNTLTKKGGLMVSRNKRFHNFKNEAPGPGTYEFSPLIQDTVLKGTFNSTLGNPMVQKMESINQGTAAKHTFLLGM